MDDPRSLPRRDRRARRGHPPGAAARPHVRARPQSRRRDAPCGAEADDAAPWSTSDAPDRLPRRRDGRRSAPPRTSSDSCADAVEQRGVAHLALSGGTTPGRTYELLAADAQDLDVVELWFADERCVGPEDEESNYRLAAETLLAGGAIAPERVHRMLGELGPEEGARRYAGLAEPGRERDEGARAARDPMRAMPVLDVIVLGIGPDGHVASLFPGAATLDAGEQAVCLGVADSPKPPPRAHHAEPRRAARRARAACCSPLARARPTRSPPRSASPAGTCPRACSGASA